MLTEGPGCAGSAVMVRGRAAGQPSGAELALRPDAIRAPLRGRRAGVRARHVRMTTRDGGGATMDRWQGTRRRSEPGPPRPAPVRDQPVADAHLLGALHGQGVERAVPHQPGQGPDRPVDRLRPAHPDRLRPRRPATPAARSARSACPSPTSATWRSCSTASRVGEMNTSMTINAPAAWLLGLYVANAEDQGVESDGSCAAPRRTTSSRST